MTRNMCKLLVLSMVMTLLSGCGAKPEVSVEKLFIEVKKFNIEQIQNLINLTETISWIGYTK